MSSNNTAVSVRGVSKSYTIAHNEERHITLAETLLARVKHPFKRAQRETFWALNDVSFDIQKGDVVGIIGRNGAGKSTLLKILSRITQPTTGEIRVHGRIGSLLEVGTGFHPELTGRENVFLNGAILGMNKAEIRKQFDAIVDFAGVEKFLDTPVKRYSSGMYVRLAFAVAAHLNPEILIVDEVLSVGDAEFQKKCLGKMKDVASGGRTVLFVSHHMQSVKVLCNRAMYLETGTCVYAGSVQGGIQRYVTSFNRPTSLQMDPQRRPGSGEMRFVSVTAGEDSYTCGDEKVVKFKVKRFKPYAGKFFVSCLLSDHQGLALVQCDSRMAGKWFDAAPEVEGEMRIRTPWLKPGAYRVDMFICSMGVQDRFEEACELNVIPLLPYPVAGNDEATSAGVIFADFQYEDYKERVYL